MSVRSKLPGARLAAHSFFTNRCKIHDLGALSVSVLAVPKSSAYHRLGVILSTSAGPEEDDLGEVVVHAAEFLFGMSVSIHHLFHRDNTHLVPPARI
jgi:hypothetical protein